MDYLIGDLQGCCDPLEHLLATIDFSPSRDRIHLLGDLVNRGPQSLAVLQRLMALGDAAQCLLGNHDLHLLAVAHGVRKPGKGDTLDPILAHEDRDALLDWLRHRRMAAEACGWLLVHAGVIPQWGAAQTLALAGEIETLLRSPDIANAAFSTIRKKRRATSIEKRVGGAMRGWLPSRRTWNVGRAMASRVEMRGRSGAKARERSRIGPWII